MTSTESSKATTGDQKVPMPDITIRLRSTRANMLGTDDEQHFCDCHQAAEEIEMLREEVEALRQELACANEPDWLER